MIRYHVYKPQPSTSIKVKDAYGSRLDVHEQKNCYLQINKGDIIPVNFENRSIQFMANYVGDNCIDTIDIHPVDPNELMSARLITSGLNFGEQFYQKAATVYQYPIQHILITDANFHKNWSFNTTTADWTRFKRGTTVKTLIIIKAENAHVYLNSTWIGPVNLPAGFQIHTNFKYLQAKAKDTKLPFHFEAMLCCGLIYKIDYKAEDLVYETST